MGEFYGSSSSGGGGSSTFPKKGPAGPAKADPSLQPLGAITWLKGETDRDGYVVLDEVSATTEAQQQQYQQRKQQCAYSNDEDLLLPIQPSRVIKLIVVSPGQLDWIIGFKPLTSQLALVIIFFLRLAFWYMQGYPSFLSSHDWITGVLSGALIALAFLARRNGLGYRSFMFTAPERTSRTFADVVDGDGGRGGGAYSGYGGDRPTKWSWWTVFWVGLLMAGVALPLDADSVRLLGAVVLGMLRSRGWWMSYLPGEVAAFMMLLGVSLPVVGGYIFFSSIIIYHSEKVIAAVPTPAITSASTAREVGGGGRRGSGLPSSGGIGGYSSAASTLTPNGQPYTDAISPRHVLVDDDDSGLYRRRPSRYSGK